MYFPFHIISLIPIFFGFILAQKLKFERKLLKNVTFGIFIIFLTVYICEDYGYSFYGYLADYFTFYLLLFLWSGVSFSLLKSNEFTFVGIFLLSLGMYNLLTGSFQFSREKIEFEPKKCSFDKPVRKNADYQIVYLENVFPTHALYKVDDTWLLMEKLFIFEKIVARCHLNYPIKYPQFKMQPVDPIDYFNYLRNVDSTAVVGFSTDNIEDLELRLGMQIFYKFKNNHYFIELPNGGRNYFFKI